MTLRFNNTLTRKKQEFKPIEQGRVRMYVCGPTVQGPAHIGHARTYIAFDVIRRYLEFKGYEVRYVMNLTDVHDDIIKVANKENKDMKEISEKFTKIFFRDLNALKIKSADVYPKVTETIEEIIDMINTLQEKGHAYEKDGSVYYKISSFADYGKFARIKLDDAKTGTRIDTDKYDKDSPMDFALWKKVKPGEPSWDSPWGKGRPGWHIECSAMSCKHLGEQIDIHGGARDLIFPHHQNEIAQSEGSTGKKPFVRYWLHTGFLNVNGEKMSKSLGNYIEVPDLIKDYDINAIRFFMLSTHYSSPIDFSKKSMEFAKNSLQRIQNFIFSLNNIDGLENEKISQKLEDAKERFMQAMDDDINTPRAFAVLFDLIKKINPLIKENKISSQNAKTVLEFFKEINSIFDFLEFEKQEISKEIESLIQKREQARQNKNYQEADKIRDELKRKGIILEDTPEGVKWKTRNGLF
ncbi:MAG: Cysteine--tRNA ligase [Candidatus Woesearchaeota archaeon]|nr:Cysteine--tRNA ligase [Candidatus Woesearchaeota archaeon]